VTCAKQIGGQADVIWRGSKWYEQTLSSCPDTADGVLNAGTGFRFVAILDGLEKALRRPVIPANQASLWHTLKLAGYTAFGSFPECNELIEQPVVFLQTWFVVVLRVEIADRRFAKGVRRQHKGANKLACDPVISDGQNR